MSLKWKDIVQDYIIRHSDKIQKVTRPLHEKLDVGYFTYHRIDTQGNYTVLVDRPDWAEFYVQTQYYLDDPYLRHPDVYKPGLCAMQHHGTDTYKERIMHDGKEIFHLDYNVLLIEKSADYVEFFGFVANAGKNRLEGVVLNHPYFLKTFAAHFKRELSPILLPMRESASSLINLKGADFFNRELIHPHTDISALIAECGMGDLVRKTARLSPQEKRCLQRIGLGESAKEIGAVLQISSRTVEFYVENIKNKLACTTKQELISVAQKCDEFSLLP